MFTGLIEELGEIRDIKKGADGATLRIATGMEQLVHGESIAVEGVCLSVTQIHEGAFSADASLETLSLTTLGELHRGSKVHLERALRLGDRLGGHLVSGHVDGVGRILSREPLGKAIRARYEVPEHLAPFLAPKGSVTIDGVSLTINHAEGATFEVALVPVTQDKSLLLSKPIGARVNIEVDVLAKYVARLLGRPGVDAREDPHAGQGVSLDLLRRQGYL